MDPNAALDRICSALQEALHADAHDEHDLAHAELAEAGYACQDLRAWLHPGGFTPEPDTVSRRIAWGYYQGWMRTLLR